ncbi:hypothetical protein LLH23_20295 [bacterium]|nr:hypothetical protein [bacterium]
MTAAKVFGMVAGGLVVACLVCVVMLLVVKLLWAWTVPDLFPGAVAQGLVAGSISWLTALKVAIVLGVLSGLAGGHRGHGAHCD